MFLLSLLISSDCQYFVSTYYLLSTLHQVAFLKDQFEPWIQSSLVLHYGIRFIYKLYWTLISRPKRWIFTCWRLWHDWQYAHLCYGRNWWRYRFYVLVWYDKPFFYLEYPSEYSYLCRPDFDSPSLFCRLLDKDIGGYFAITPPPGLGYTTKQYYLPSSCILQTKYIHESGVVNLVDFFPRPKAARATRYSTRENESRELNNISGDLRKWLVRRVECIRGSLTIGINYST